MSASSAKTCSVLAAVKAATGCKILLALKCFAMFRLFPLISETLDGVCASSPHEARLGFEEFGREVHTFAAAYAPADIEELCRTLTISCLIPAPSSSDFSR